MDSLETFEDYLKNELGPDKVKNIKCHFLLTCSQLKPTMDYIFSNLYSEKSTKIVDLNLKLDETNKSVDCDSSLINDTTRLKVSKNKELKKRLAELKANLNHGQLEINELEKTVEATQNKLNTSKNNLLNKQIKHVTQKSKFNLAQEIGQTIDKSSKIFEFIKDSTLKRSSNQDESHSLTNKNLEESLNTAVDLINHDKDWIDQSINSFANDLELISYRINSSAQLNNLDQTNVEIFESVNEINFDLLTKASHILKYKEETQRFSTLKNQIKTKFIGFLKENYSSKSISTYGQYLKSYLMCKSVEANLIEIDTFLKYLENETNALVVTNSSRTNFTQIFLNDLKETIQTKQLKINNLFRDNISKVDTQFSNYQTQLKAQLDLLSSSIASFHLDCSFNMSSSNLYMLLQKDNIQQVQVYQREDEDDDVITKCLKHEMFFKNTNMNSKLVLFNKFISLYNEIKKSMHDYEKNHKMNSRTQLLKETTASLEQTISKCKITDLKIHSKFSELLKLKFSNMNSLENDLNEIEKLKEIWIAQPAVNTCVFDSLTVLGKEINYYMSIIDEKVAHHKRTLIN